jgi:hypothetical protein
MRGIISSNPVMTTNRNFEQLIDTGILNAKILTSRHLAELFHLSHKTVERYRREGKIPGHFRFDRW